MKIMVVGGGGREHAIIKKIKETKSVLGDEFLNYVKDGMKITVKADGIVEVE